MSRLPAAVRGWLGPAFVLAPSVSAVEPHGQRSTEGCSKGGAVCVFVVPAQPQQCLAEKLGSSLEEQLC